MRFLAIKSIAPWFLLLSCGTTLFSAANCRCTARPNGPGGGVACTTDQIATCDPSSGECNCACDSVDRGKAKNEYIAFIFSRVFEQTVEVSDLYGPKYEGVTAVFLRSEQDGVFSLPKTGAEGRRVRVNVSVPEWLEEILKSPRSR